MLDPRVITSFYGSYIDPAVLAEVDLVPERFGVARLAGFEITISPWRTSCLPAAVSCIAFSPRPPTTSSTGSTSTHARYSAAPSGPGRSSRRVGMAGTGRRSAASRKSSRAEPRAPTTSTGSSNPRGIMASPTGPSRVPNPSAGRRAAGCRPDRAASRCAARHLWEHADRGAGAPRIAVARGPGAFAPSRRTTGGNLVELAQESTLQTIAEISAAFRYLWTGPVSGILGSALLLWNVLVPSVASPARYVLALVLLLSFAGLSFIAAVFHGRTAPPVG